MKTLLPKHLKELCIIDEVLGDFVNSKLDFTERFFYKPTSISAPLIARTFDIDINNLTFSQTKKILKSPMLSKSNLGTKKALKEAFSKVFGEVVIQTKTEDSKLRAFEFSLKTNINEGINEESIYAMNNIIKEIKPLRDNLAGLDFQMPTLQKKINLKTSILWRI